MWDLVAVSNETCLICHLYQDGETSPRSWDEKHALLNILDIGVRRTLNCIGRELDALTSSGDYYTNVKRQQNFRSAMARSMKPQIPPSEPPLVSPWQLRMEPSPAPTTI
nr:uncharacterized protein LOC117226217 [Megalopta genalis]